MDLTDGKLILDKITLLNKLGDIIKWVQYLQLQ